MEFNKKLQELRKQKSITQEDLARAIYVSRTAVSKWESGRGFPSIDSLKAIAKYFETTVDQLLSSEELLNAVQEENKKKEKIFHDLIFGLLDCSVIIFFILPFFGQKVNSLVEQVSLLYLTQIETYLKIVYFTMIIGIAVLGVLTLALQNCQWLFWVKNKQKISILFNMCATLVFIISLQSYAAVFLFTYLAIKVILLAKG